MGPKQNARKSKVMQGGSGDGDEIITKQVSTFKISLVLNFQFDYYVMSTAVLKVIAAARKGSYVDITLISKTLAVSKDSITVQSLDALLCHFQAEVPAVVEPKDAPNLQCSTFFKKRMMALTGLSVLYGHAITIREKDIELLLKTSWPDMFRWMQFFNDAYVTKRLGDEGQNDVMYHLLLDVFLAFLVVQNGCTAKFVTETPGAVRMVTQLWIREGLDKPVPSIDMKSSTEAAFVLLLAIEDKPSKEVLDELVEGANSVGEQLSVVLQTRLKFALNSGGELLKVAEILAEVVVRVTISQHSHPLRQEFLSHGMVPFMVNCLATIATKLSLDGTAGAVSSIIGIFTHGFRFICHMFYATSGVQWVLQAVEAGFLEAFVACDPMFPLFSVQERDRILSLFSESFMPFLIFLPVVIASSDAIKRIEMQNA